MNHSDQLSDLIACATKEYLTHAGDSGNLLRVFTTEFERVIIITTLKYFQGNLTISAKSLGISRTTLNKKLKQFESVSTQR